MARKTKEEALATRTLLLDAAERLFSTQGVSGTSLHEIAEAAGLTRGAIYWHFENKSELLLALWERIRPMCEAFTQETCSQYGNDPLQRLRRNACYISRHIESDPHAHALMSILMLHCEFTAETYSAGEYFMREREFTLCSFREDFVAAIAAGQLPADLDPEQATLGLFAIVDGLCLHWLIDPKRFAVVSTTERCVATYLAGLMHPDSTR